MRRSLLLMFVALTACTVDYTAEIQSNTSWTGVFINRTVDGSGNRIVDIPDDFEPPCVAVQKDTEEGYVRARVTTSGGFLGPGDGDWVETTAQYGAVTACAGQ